MQISVKTLTGKTTTQRTLDVKTITLDVEASGAVLSIKAKIQEQEDIAPNQQHLVFMDESLGNDRTLADYNIQEGAVLHLQAEWGMQICVETWDNKTIMMDIVPVDTIAFIRAMLQSEEGIPTISPAGVLKGDRTLSDYDIRKGAHTPPAAEAAGGATQIFVKTLTGKTITTDAQQIIAHLRLLLFLL